MNDYTLIYFMKFIKSNEIGYLLNLLKNYEKLEYICKYKYGKELKIIDCSNKYTIEEKNNKYIFIKWKYIYNNYFNFCNKIKKVFIANNIKLIGMYSFYDCTLLTSVTLSNNIKYIDLSAFENCISLTAINLPCSIKSIGFSSFLNCNSLNSILISKSINSIMNKAFYQCSSLILITLPKKFKNQINQIIDNPNTKIIYI